MSREAASVFGFAIESRIPLRFLRIGGGTQTLVVEEADGPREMPTSGLVGRWPLHGSAVPAEAALFETPTGFEYWTTDAGRFEIDLARGRIEVPPMEDEILREQRLHGVPMLLHFAHRGDFSLHAAAAEVAGRAVVFAAPSKFGKTTLAYAFHRLGHRLLSEDLACIRPGSFELLPGPAVIRLRPDVFSGELPMATELVVERPDRVFLRPDLTRSGGSGPIPIAGIFFLREGDDLRVSEAPVVQSVQDLWHLGYRMPTPEGRAQSFRQLTQLADAVPVWNVQRPMRMSALDATVDRIAEVVTRGV